MLAFMQERPQLAMAYSQHVEIDEHGNMLGLAADPIPYSPYRLLLEFMTYQLRLIRIDAYRAVSGFDPEMGVSTDYDLCLRLSERFEIAQLPRPLYRYRVRRDSVSQRNRLQQVRTSFAAAQRALQRRGMERSHALSLGVRARHVLRSEGCGRWVKAHDRADAAGAGAGAWRCTLSCHGDEQPRAQAFTDWQATLVPRSRRAAHASRRLPSCSIRVLRSPPPSAWLNDALAHAADASEPTSLCVL